MTDDIRRTPAAENETDEAWDRFTDERRAVLLAAARVVDDLADRARPFTGPPPRAEP